MCDYFLSAIKMISCLVFRLATCGFYISLLWNSLSTLLHVDEEGHG